MASSSGGGNRPSAPRPGQPAPWQPPATPAAPAQPQGWGQPVQQPAAAWQQPPAAQQPIDDPAAAQPRGDEKYNTVFLVGQLQQQRRRALIVGSVLAIAAMIGIALFLSHEASKPSALPKAGQVEIVPPDAPAAAPAPAAPAAAPAKP